MNLVQLTTAPDQITAETWRGLLEDEGVPAVVRAGDTSTFLGVSPYPCGILVAEDQLDRARKLLESRLGNVEEEPPV